MVWNLEFNREMILSPCILSHINILVTSVLTPHFKEDVIYSMDELHSSKEGVSILFYMRMIYPGEKGLLFYFVFTCFFILVQKQLLLCLYPVVYLRWVEKFLGTHGMWKFRWSKRWKRAQKLGFFPWSNIEQNRWIERFSNINVCGHWFQCGGYN